MKMIKELGYRYVIGFLIVASTLILAPLLLEAEYVNQPMDTVGGSFTSSGFVAEPFIIDLALFNLSKSEENALNAGEAMTPQVEHKLTFQVGYGDGMDSESGNPLENFFVNIKVFYLESCDQANPCLEAELTEAFNQLNTTHPDGGVFRYNFSPSAFSLVTDSTIHTWEILEDSIVSEVDVTVPDTLEVVSGYAFDFRFKPSKTAIEDFEDGSWLVMVEFGIDNGPSSYESLSGYRMEWYGEISVDEGTQAIWTGLDVQQFNNSDNDYRYTNLTNSSIEGWQGIRYISNGPYIHTKRASTTTWTSDRGFEATLVESEDLDYPLEPQEFMIRINTLNTFNPALRAIQLNSDRVDLNNILQRSLEVGREKNFYVFIRLAPDFQNATYSGTMDFGISNLPSGERGNVDKSTVGFMFGNEQYPTEKIPVTSREDLEGLSINGEEFVVIGAGTVYERLYLIDPSASDFVLAADLDLSGSDWTPIGNSNDPFTGSLVGNGFEIQNLTIDGGTNVGLFGVATNADFENIVLTGVSINGDTNVGALVGSGTTVTMTDIKVYGTVEGTIAVGSVAGSITQNSRSILSQLENFADVKGSFQIGGLVGSLRGTLEESINRGQVEAIGPGTTNNADIGGLVGSLTTNSSDIVVIQNSYNTGTVDGKTYNNVGGLVGRIDRGSLINSFNTGSVLGSGSSRGGVLGSKGTDPNIVISNTIFKQDSSLNNGLNAVGSGSVPVANAKAQAPAQLRNVYNFNTWDFASAWGINVFDDSINNGYPFLQWEGHPILDIRADVIPPSQSVLTGIQTFTIRAAVGPSHPVGLDNWTLELIQDPDNQSSELQSFGATTFGAIGINQSININTLFRRNLEHKYLLTVTDDEGRVVTKAAFFNINNPVASGAVNIIEDGDNQIVVNFDSQVSIREGVTLTGSAFVIELFEFDIPNTQATPDPTTYEDEDIDVAQGRGKANPTLIDPERVESVTLINNVLQITIADGITLPAGDRFYFRLTFLEEAQSNIVNIGNNPLSTTYARDLVRPLAIRVSDFTAQGLSGAAGHFPRGYTFSVTEDIVVTRLIGGHSGTTSNDIFELAIFEVVSTTNPRPKNADDPLIRFRLIGAPTSSVGNHHFPQSEYVVGNGGVKLEPGKVYIIIQYRTNGNGAHYRALGDIDYQQIESFNTRIVNWGPTDGGNWRFIGNGLDAIKTASFHTENTRPALGFRYILPEEGGNYGTQYTETDSKPAN